MKALSHSSISLYLECPQKFKFRYVDKLPQEPKSFFSFGQSIHSTLQFFYENSTVPTLEQTLDHFSKNWVAAGYKNSQHEQEEKVKGVQILTDFYAKHAPIFRKPIFTEYRFNTKIEGVPVIGFIDRIDKLSDNTLVITDYKTGSSLVKGRALSDPQLTLYQIACEELLNKKVSKVILYHVNSLVPSVSPAHSIEQTQFLRNQIVKVAQSIEKGLFLADPTPTKCSRCDYRNICPSFIPSVSSITLKKK